MSGKYNYRQINLIEAHTTVVVVECIPATFAAKVLGYDLARGGEMGVASRACVYLLNTDTHAFDEWLTVNSNWATLSTYANGGYSE